MKNALFVAMLSPVFAAPALAVPVDLELQLLVDVSGSVSGSEFALQRDGYADAFRSTGIIDAVGNGDIGSIATQLVYWSSFSSQAVAVDWTLIDGADSANAFADSVTAAARPFSGGTSIDGALTFGRSLFANGFEGTRLVQDVSGDGGSNLFATQEARDLSAAEGITVNGLPIGGSSSIEAFYTDSVITADGFVVAANSFEDFGTAVSEKLGREIAEPMPMPGPSPAPEPGPMPSPVPLPAGGLLLLSALAAIGRLGRRRS